MPKLRTLHKNTMQTLGAPHTLPTLMAPFLLCLLVGMTVFLLNRFCYIAALVFLPQSVAEVLHFTVILFLEISLILALLLPLWLGRLRMAGLLLAGEAPAYGACFYYFKDKKRYFRALGASVLLALIYGLAGLAIFGAFSGVFHLCSRVLVYYFPRLTPYFLVILLHVALAVTAGVIYLLGYFLPFAAIVVGNEEVGVSHAFVRAVRAGRRNMGKSFVFAVRQILWLLLCLASVMVLYALWYSHYFNLIYLRYSMALFEEEIQ